MVFGSKIIKIIVLILVFYVTNTNSKPILENISYVKTIRNLKTESDQMISLSSPEDVITQNDLIFIVDHRAKTVYGVSKEGVIVLKIKHDKMDSPQSVVVAEDGRIYISDDHQHSVFVFDSDGRYEFSIGQRGNKDGEFYRPMGLALDRFGNLYVTDKSNHRVQKFTREGIFLMLIGGEKGNRLGQLSDPTDIAVDNDGNIFVADYGNYRIVKYDINGKPIKAFGGRGDGNGEFGEIGGISVSQRNRIFVSDMKKLRVVRFDNYGNYISAFGSGGGRVKFNSPRGIYIESTGDIYIADPQAQKVQVFAIERKEPPKPPATPTGLIAQSTGQTIELSWKPNAENDLSHYIVTRSTLSEMRGFEPIAEAVSENKYIDTDVEVGRTYWYRIQAVNLNTDRSFSSKVVSSKIQYQGMNRIRITVFDFEDDPGNQRQYGSVIASFLSTEFIDNGYFEVLDRDNMQRILDEKGLSQTGLVAESSRQQAGALLGVDLMVFGAVNVLNDIEIDARMTSVESGKAILSSHEFAVDERHLREAVRRLCEDMVSKYHYQIGSIVGTIQPPVPPNAIIKAIQGTTIKGKASVLSDGTYHIPHLPKGTYNVVIEAPEYNEKIVCDEITVFGNDKAQCGISSPPEKKDLPPLPPTQIEVNNTNEGVKIRWKMPIDDDVVGYRVHRSSSAAFGYSLLDQTPIPEFLDNDIQQKGGTFYYCISAVDAIGQESDRSSPVEITIPQRMIEPQIKPLTPPVETPQPSPPHGLNLKIEERRVILQWNDGSDTLASSYHVYRSNKPNTGFVRIATPIRANYIDSDVVPETTYYYYITAVSSQNSESSPSEIKSISIVSPKVESSVGCERGEQELDQGNFEDAIPFLQDCISKGGGTGQHYLLLGIAYQRSQQYKKARDSFKDAIRKDDSLVDAHLRLARMYMILEDHESARQTLEKVLELDPENGYAQRLLEQLK